MKLLSYLFTLFFAFNALAVAPYGIKGQQQAPTLYSNVHQFPNNQVTNLGGINALVESGNSNILSNPSFEHSIFSTDWSFSGTSSFFEDVTRVLNGKKSSGILAVSTSFALVQDSTLYASQFAGQVQGIATVRIKANTGATNIKVCSRQAGVTSTTNCVDVVANDTWGLYKVPFILGATSNGISIASTGNTTSVVYIDDAFVGVTDIAQVSNNISVQSSYLVQTATFSNATITGTQTYTEGSGIYSYASGIYTALKPAVVTITASLQATSASVAPQIFKNATVIGASDSVNSATFVASASASFTVTTGDTFRVANGSSNASSSQKITVSATEYLTISTYSSPVTINADKIGEIIHTTNSIAPQGFISALNKSIGQTGSGATYTGQTYFALYEHLWSIAGLTTTAGDVYRISSAKGASASADFAANKIITVDYETNAPFIRGKASAAGVGAYTDSENKDHFHIGGDRRATAFPYSSGAPYGRTSTSNGVVSTQGGTEVSSLAHTSSIGGTEAKPKNVSLNIFIRYAGDTQLITGQFNGLQTCTDTLACTDTFSAKITGGGIVSGENVDWISGNASLTDTSLYAISFNTGIFTTAPNCTLTEIDAVTTLTTSVKNSTEPTSSGASVRTGFNTTASSFTKAVVPFHIICQKQGADYIGKTAMAVASDQNVRSIGSTNVDIQSVYFGSGATCGTVCSSNPCTICKQSGNKITSVSWLAAGNYILNGIDGTKYTCTGTAGTTVSAVVPLMHSVTSSGPTTAAIYYGTNTLNNSVQCIGIP